MQLNHHILAKATTDAVLNKFKTEEWNCWKGLGRDFFRVTTNASFPSPDAAFYDQHRKFLVSFEFKPPTETKRGVLTGVGQSIAYLRDSNVSYLIAPQSLEDFNMGEFLKDLYVTQIYGKLPAGLIIYENNNPVNVSLVSNICPDIQLREGSAFSSRNITTSRFWAKYQDLPVALFHLLLHCYFLKKSHTIEGDAFKYCWTHHMISPSVLTDFRPRKILDCSGNVIRTPQDTKDLMFLEKKLKKTQSLSADERVRVIRHEIDTEFTGDNSFQAYKKNFVTFLKHLRVIDSEGEITENGFRLYQIGLVNGPQSKVFQDYFTKEILITGHHLELLLDLEKQLRENPNKTFNEILSGMEGMYEEKGFIKRNPNRKAQGISKVVFLKYECILWRSLGIIKKLSNKRYYIDWKVITEICSLPD